VTQLEPASFEVERFELARNACLEVRGRWFGVRGRRFMRPTLTAVAGGREHRLLAVLDHKPWVAEEGETWLAAFPCSTDPAALLEAELTVAPDVTVSLPPPSLPPPSAPAAGRRRRTAAKRPPASRADTPARAEKPVKSPKDEAGAMAGAEDSALQVEHAAALRSRDEALSELGAVQGDRDRLRQELKEALAARDAAIAERHEVIDGEVSVRIAELRAEAERERAAAGLAAQIARERDTAREERAEAIRERDDAHAERDTALRERNRMLAQRDTARTLALDATRQWEATAALGTRRTQERDAVASERERATRERDAAVEERDRTANQLDTAIQERDGTANELHAAIQERDRIASELDAAIEERDRTANQLDTAIQERDDTANERDAALGDRDRARREHEEALREQTVGLAGRAVTSLDLKGQPAPGERAPAPDAAQPPARRRAAAETASAAPTARIPARPSAPVSVDPGRGRRPRQPPAPIEARVARGSRDSGEESRPMAHAGSPRDPADIWRARVLAIGGLLITLVVLVVTLTAK
jgi:hypothetical protein